MSQTARYLAVFAEVGAAEEANTSCLSGVPPFMCQYGLLQDAARNYHRSMPNLLDSRLLLPAQQMQLQGTERSGHICLPVDATCYLVEEPVPTSLVPRSAYGIWHADSVASLALTEHTTSVCQVTPDCKKAPLLHCTPHRGMVCAHARACATQGKKRRLSCSEKGTGCSWQLIHHCTC